MKVQCLYQSKNGRKDIVHFLGCHYINRNASSPKMLRTKPTKIYGSEFHFCQHCSPVSLKYREERKDIEAIAQEPGQTLTLEHGMLKIANGYSEWLVVPSNSSSSLSLYHKNTMNKLDDPTLIDGYHLQIASIHSIVKVLLYIVDHDRYRKQVNAQKRAEQKHIQELTKQASAAYFKKEGKRKPQKKHFTHKERQVITADTSDWEAFQALFKPNAAR